MKPPAVAEDWFEAEESTRAGMIAELQRIRIRTRNRPLRVLLLAALLTGAIGYKIISKKPVVEADVVLALTEGAMDTKGVKVPADQLRQYVSEVLLPDAKLTELIERRDLFRLRKRLGDQYALEELRSQFEITVWKNSFQYYDEEDDEARKSARIGITVMDTDPDRGYAIALDLANIAISVHASAQQAATEKLASQVATARTAIEANAAAVDKDIATRQTALVQAEVRHDAANIAAAKVDLTRLEADAKRLKQQLATVAGNHEALANRFAAAGLNETLELVEQRRPEHSQQSPFVVVLILVVVGTGALIGSALTIGAFDSKIHDTDDVRRLGLPVLGHVPGFPGDHVGSLDARGAAQGRVPSFLRWRFHR